MEYLDNLNKLEFSNLDIELRNYAKENDVPIIQDEGLHFLRQVIMLKNARNILEVGTAIGYSAIQMAKLGANVDTIEINEESYKIALENVKKANLSDKITIYNEDALLIDISKLKKYDLIFIDAAKAQYINFFNKFKVLLNDKGVIVTDNLLFHGLVLETEFKSRNLRQLVNKIRNYNEWLLEQDDFDTTIYNIGDGLALSIKK
ncbi:MAG: O-methyltransferase [Acholeplasmatales bacterium]|nr:O-methyltransferase [Acholeplasmatales bacterium]